MNRQPSSDSLTKMEEALRKEEELLKTAWIFLAADASFQSRVVIKLENVPGPFSFIRGSTGEGD